MADLRATRLSKRFSGLTVVSDVSLTIRPGEVVGPKFGPVNPHCDGPVHDTGVGHREYLSGPVVDQENGPLRSGMLHVRLHHHVDQILQNRFPGDGLRDADHGGQVEPLQRRLCRSRHDRFRFGAGMRG